MRMKRRMKKRSSFFLSVLVIMVCVFSSSFIGNMTVQGEENIERAASGDSGGFIIESVKVDGVLDLAGILLGKITIYEGDIYGLTITKKISLGGNQEPLIIKITSPGPIPVKRLTASTKGHSIPEFGGLCKPEKAGRVCMEDVSMTVTAQEAASIALPDAKVETCYARQCGPLPEGSSMSEEQFKEFMKQIEDNESDLKEILEGVEKDSEQLSVLEKLLKDAMTAWEVIDSDQTESLIHQLTSTLDKNVENINLHQLAGGAIELARKKDHYLQTVANFSEAMSKAEPLVEHLEMNLTQMEAKLEEIESFESKAVNDPKILLVQRYIELIDVSTKTQATIKDSSTEVRTKLEEHKKIIIPILDKFKSLLLEINKIEADKIEIVQKTNSLEETIVDKQEQLNEEEEEDVIEPIVSIPKDLLDNGNDQEQKSIVDTGNEIKEPLIDIVSDLPLIEENIVPDIPLVDTIKEPVKKGIPKTSLVEEMKGPLATIIPDLLEIEGVKEWLILDGGIAEITEIDEDLLNERLDKMEPLKLSDLLKLQ